MNVSKYAWLLLLTIGCARGSSSRLDQPRGPIVAKSLGAISARHTIFPITSFFTPLNVKGDVKKTVKRDVNEGV